MWLLFSRMEGRREIAFIAIPGIRGVRLNSNSYKGASWFRRFNFYLLRPLELTPP